MKKVLILSGSPRRGGNSDTLCDQFLKGAQEAGNEVEKIFVAGKKIGYCNACYYCKNHEGKCSIQDDMAEVLQKMLDADVLVCRRLCTSILSRHNSKLLSTAQWLVGWSLRTRSFIIS